MENITKKLNAVWVSGILFATTAALALADTTANSNSITLTDPLGGATFEVVANNVIYFISTAIAIPLTAIMVLVGAFQITTSAGDPEKFSQGRKTILYAAIGFAIAIIATGVTSLIKNILGSS